jgi:hypothetical protein
LTSKQRLELKAREIARIDAAAAKMIRDGDLIEIVVDGERCWELTDQGRAKHDARMAAKQ